MKALTVLHVNTERGYRGGEIQNLHLAMGLEARGHRSILAVQDGSGLAERAAERGLDVRPKVMRGEFDLRAAAWLHRLIGSERPHLLHYHTSHAITLGALATLPRPRPAAVATRRTSFPTSRNPLFRFKFTFRLQHVITVSGWIRDDLVAAGLPPGRVSVVHSGIDLGRYSSAAGDGSGLRRELSLPPGAPVVGCVGALAPQKGHRLLLEAVARLAGEFPSLQIVLVGEGALRHEILADADRLGIAERVHLTGFRDDVPRVTAAFDISVLPSAAGEGSPAAVKEAMALGIPVVATDLGGVAEILSDGAQGLLIPGDDGAALEGALARLLRDPELRARMGAAGRQRAREFSMERMVERTEAVYREALGLGGLEAEEPAA